MHISSEKQHKNQPNTVRNHHFLRTFLNGTTPEEKDNF